MKHLVKTADGVIKKMSTKEFLEWCMTTPKCGYYYAMRAALNCPPNDESYKLLEAHIDMIEKTFDREKLLW